MDTIRKYVEKIRWNSIIKTILTILAGVVLIVVPETSANLLYRLIGIVLMVIGLVSILRRFLFGLSHKSTSATGVVLLLLGLFGVVKPAAMTAIQNIVIGIFLAVDGMLSLENAVLCARSQLRGWVYMLIFSVLAVALGVFIMLSPVPFTILLAGIALTADGVLDLILIILFGKKISSLYDKL